MDASSFRTNSVSHLWCVVQRFLSPWADFATKRWEPDRWRALARHVTERGFQVAIVGPPQAKALADDIVGDTHVNLPSLLRRACLVVTVDSGPLHVCDAMNVPVIGLHGLTRLSEAGPYWDNTLCVEANEMGAISVDAVTASFERWVAGIGCPTESDRISFK
ncbi:glycosyltransferase family 9 protein [Xanthomonas oryzae]|uniref:glycosyltransferase family 9 protein n=1 Tax=Xanthomonas oryzae TaxID=347 RepID=UPI001F5F7080|nr:glycosyltransferase family 9 protein [Xanthomonas oryzae]